MQFLEFLVTLAAVISILYGAAVGFILFCKSVYWTIGQIDDLLEELSK